MATILLSAAGAALGSGIGGTVLGLSGAVVGRSVGAAIGRSIDQRILGSGSDAVEVGKVDRFHLGGVGYGTPIKEVWGRMRVAGEIVWASRFLENRRTSGGGKGSPRPATESFTYSVSIAVALCQGVALRVGRIWADGVEIAANSLNLRFYSGSEDQLPDPKIEAVEGVGFAPSYRGICYVVIEGLALARFGNRVPQFSFEVIRRAQGPASEDYFDLPRSVTAVALIPGSGEYALATTPVHFNYGLGKNRSANVHSIHGVTDFVASLEQLDDELPNCGSVSLVVSWFGNDLRCGSCLVQPKVEQHAANGVEMPWSVSGIIRSAAALVPQVDGRPVYGGTPTDASVLEAIRAIRDSGKEVMFYPFILMDQGEGNGLPDPWSSSDHQPVLPWRGRITLNQAPGRPGSTDQTVAAGIELAAFLGEARPEHFSIIAGSVIYMGPQEWSYRRFILHYAHLCALAGGVDAFCVGSELRGLTQIRSSQMQFPMVEGLRELATDVKMILGNQTRVSYAADWSEYFGYQVNGDVFFHLDGLWSDPSIDFVGIDNYMPISDWRDGPVNADGHWGSIYSLDYLVSNIAGGEGYDWYYDSPEGEAAQRRVPIEDGEHGEAWIYRYKDLKNWWSNDHHDRVGGVRLATATGWVPGMKPIIFTEYGCAAIDKATNQPNRFLDPKSSESSLPRGSNAVRDDYIQMQYFHAMRKYWSDVLNNPVASLYNGSMIDLDRCHAWAWDARPFPDFPGNLLDWSDGINYPKGHWLNGRASNQPIASVISEICSTSGVNSGTDVKNLTGALRGFTTDSSESSRAKLQSLMLAYSIDVGESEGVSKFAMRSDGVRFNLDRDLMAITADEGGALRYSRTAVSDAIGRARLTYVQAEADYEIKTVEAFSDAAIPSAGQTELSLQFTSVEANAVAERWLAESRLSRESIRFLLPRSFLDLAANDIVALDGNHYRVDRIEDANELIVDAVRADMRAYLSGSESGSSPVRISPLASTPVFAAFLDLPLLTGDEIPHAPHVAVSATPWPGAVGIWSSSSDAGYTLNQQTSSPAIVGVTRNELCAAPSGLWDRGSMLRVELTWGNLSSAPISDVLNGANMLAIGDGSPENWEVLQFSEANLVGQNIYELSVLLRGLAGTDAFIPSIWPIGSLVVVLDGVLPQINLLLASRGLTRFYKFGALTLGHIDASVITLPLAFQGIGLRPYSVSHLTASGIAGQDIEVTWIRRTRIDGDSWQSAEVPLGEETQSYTVVVSSGAALVREIEVFGTFWQYTQAMQLSDGLTDPFNLSVAQNSVTFGPGPFNSIAIA